MNKQSLVAQIIAHLDAELLRYAHAARTAQAEATDEQSRAENKYDTRGLEASYLAHGQGRQTIETMHAREQFAAMELRDFSPGEPITVGALIEVESDGVTLWYFVGPSSGGTEVICEGREVLVITALSPLGRLLLGKKRDDSVELASGGSRLVYRIAVVA